MQNAGLDDSQAGSRLPGEISITSDMQINHPQAERKEELKSLLMKVKEKSENIGLKLNIPKTKIMASDPITSWQMMETVTDFIWGAPKSQQMVTVAMKLREACSLEEKL